MHESVSARHWRHSARLCLPLPVTTRPGGGTTGPIDIAKFNAITVDATGESGMTPAQVIEKVGFTGERFDKPTNTGGTSTYLFRESPKKYIEVRFNRNEKAIDNVLYGIDFITLQKYQAVNVASTGGTTLDQVNTSFGVTGVKSFSFGTITTYRCWQHGDKNTVTITFSNSNNRATSKILTGGLPGILTKAKYDRIVVGNLGTPGTGGGAGTAGTSPTIIGVNNLLEFTGELRSSFFATTTTYRWAESLTRYVEVDFQRDGTGTRRASAKRVKGVPGVLDTP